MNQLNDEGVSARITNLSEPFLLIAPALSGLYPNKGFAIGVSQCGDILCPQCIADAEGSGGCHIHLSPDGKTYSEDFIATVELLPKEEIAYCCGCLQLINSSSFAVKEIIP